MDSILLVSRVVLEQVVLVLVLIEEKNKAEWSLFYPFPATLSSEVF